ncbi:MAG: AAA family ATPase [Acidobacteria bacterium]|nr:AAA family ATPase [Acidobacteriota bacterium]
MVKRGLIVGKFYPPHRGHKHLIDTARAQVDELTVIACRREGEVPDGELRAAWLREIHPDVRVMLIDDTYDAQDSRVWAENCTRWLGGAPDVVFTSEEYGDEFARHLGCRHVQVDKARMAVPVSGTRVRRDPLGCWEFLEPPVRGFYAARVCVVGAESTGKTTLARDLAQHFETAWVPEYGREYSERKLAREGGYDFRSEEFAHIAARQCELEDEAARRANKVLICDTDAFATSVWHRRYMGARSPEVEERAARRRRPDLYILTDIRTPFEQDGTRDGEHVREWMHQIFAEELRAQGRPFKSVTGPREERVRQAVGYIEELLAGFKRG